MKTMPSTLRFTLSSCLNFVKKYFFVILIISAIIIKCILTINLPIYARDPVGADEYLMLEQAEYLAAGKYLGPYNYLTLVKGIMFPLTLAVLFKFGIPLYVFYTLFYASVCLIALIPLRRLVKTKSVQLIFFLLLLFCPASMDNNVQLIYRNMMIVPQSILLVSSLMMVYISVIDSNQKKLLFWSFFSSCTWIYMWHTREDTIWSLPLFATAWLISIVALLRHRRQNKLTRNNCIINTLIISAPAVFLWLSISCISLINYHHYGIFTTNQLNDSNYTKAVTLMVSIKPEQEIEHVEITRSTLQTLYKVSPSLAKISDIIESDYEKKNGLVMASEDNGEINEDLITWELTGAAASKGYYASAATAEAYWGSVYDEINAAVSAGLLETRPTLPSRSLIPFPQQSGAWGKLATSITSLYLRAAKYESSTVKIYISKLDANTTQRYEAITGGYALCPEASNSSLLLETADTLGYTEAISSPNALIRKAARWTRFVNYVQKIYSILTPPLLAFGILYFILITLLLVFHKNARRQSIATKYLFLAASFGSLTAMLIGLGYVNAFMVDVNGYLASVNGLLALFVALATAFCLEDIVQLLYYSPRDLAITTASLTMLRGI